MIQSHNRVIDSMMGLQANPGQACSMSPLKLPNTYIFIPVRHQDNGCLDFDRRRNTVLELDTASEINNRAYALV